RPGELDELGQDPRQLTANGGGVRISPGPAIVELFHCCPHSAKTDGARAGTRTGETPSNELPPHIEASGGVAAISCPVLDLHDDAASVLEIEAQYTSHADPVEAQKRDSRAELRATKRGDLGGDRGWIGRSPNRSFNYWIRIARLFVGDCAGKLVT